MQVTSQGSVRVDIVGGTLDLEPINLIIPNVVTLNVATSLKAQVEIQEIEPDKLEIVSKDYNKTYSYNRDEISDENLYQLGSFKEMTFVLQILDLFNIRGGVKVSLQSGAPAGSGLGGSSAMGMTLFKALSQYKNQSYETHRAVAMVKGVEGRILNQGIPGYQDYYPAMVGGILALRGIPGKIQYEQLYSSKLKEFLESHITLVYSGLSRDSGINNWQVYKDFFDGKESTRKSMYEIANVSFQTYEALKEEKFEDVLKLIGQEGELRKGLATSIVPSEVDAFFTDLKNQTLVYGMKMCGAGGGGCFILTHAKEAKEKVQKLVRDSDFQVLDFLIDAPL